MAKQVLLCSTIGEAGDEVERALVAARNEKRGVTITCLPEAGSESWLVEVDRYRSWDNVSKAVKKAIATFEKVSFRTIRLMVAEMEAVKQALTEFERD